MSNQRSMDKKLVVQPIFGAFIHDYVFEGPCRMGKGEELTAAYDKLKAGEAFKRFNTTIAKQLSEDEFTVLDPVYFERNEEFLVQREVINAMSANDAIADCYLIGSSGRIFDDILELAEKTRKPILSTHFCCGNTQIVAMLRNRGLEGYAAIDWNGLTKQLALLRVRKIMRDTNVLLINRGNSTSAIISSCCNFISLEKATEKIGPHFRFMDLHEFLDHVTLSEDGAGNHTLPTRHGQNLNSGDMEMIEAMADELIAGAEACHMDRKYVVNSLKPYRLLQKVMERMECSAYALPCPESCATTRLNQEQFTFCLCHSLMNEGGFPGGCEYDVPALLALQMLSLLSRTPPYMGNTVNVTMSDDLSKSTTPFFPYNGLDVEVLKIPLEERKNLILTSHSVPNRRMHGFDTDPDRYCIRPFTGSGWGATLRRDFAADIGQPLTIARYSADAESLFVARGVIKGGCGWDFDGCTAGVIYSVADRKDFFEKQLYFGNHMALVYGDVFDDAVALGKLMGLKVVTA